MLAALLSTIDVYPTMWSKHAKDRGALREPLKALGCVGEIRTVASYRLLLRHLRAAEQVQ